MIITMLLPLFILVVVVDCWLQLTAQSVLPPPVCLMLNNVWFGVRPVSLTGRRTADQTDPQHRNILVLSGKD